MKKRILLVLLTIALTVGIFGALTIVAGAEAAAPEMSITFCNISFRDSVCIKYAVDANVSDVKILIWNSPETEYTIGTHDDEITEYYTENINGVAHMIFDYTKLSAKQMTDVVYARAYSRVDGTDYYSEVNKYSILQYAYNKLGKTGTASDDAEFTEMLTNMLAYGASAQKYFNYNEDRLATTEWYQVKLTDGHLSDGSKSGLFLQGDTVTLVAPETDANGCGFSYWADSNGNKVTTAATYEVTVGAANEIYTPAYEHSFGEWVTVKEATTLEEGLMERVCGCGAKETQTIEKIIPELAYALNDDGKSYSVTGIGTWTDSVLTIPDTYKGLPVTSIGYKAFGWCDNLTTVAIPNSITYISGDAFTYCKNLTSIVIPDSITYIGSRAFQQCNSLTSVIIPDNVTLDYLAFGWCDNLNSVTIGKNVTFAGSYVFDYCTNLTSVVIGNGATYIGDHAFNECTSLTSVVIPSSVTSLKTSVFSLCSDLTSITFEGTIEQWEAISKDSFWDYQTGNYTIYCTDGTMDKSGNIVG